MKKVITFIAIAAITLSTAQKTAAQEIDAPEVCTWTADKQAITPDHKYNSISIYLLNAGSIENLYSGKSLPEEKDIPKEERNRLKELKKNLKGGEYAKYIYLSAELEDPKNREVLTFPIYCLDRQDSKRQTFDSREKVPILSKVDDSFLQTELSAKGSITAIKGNKNAETLQKIGDITIGLLETALAIKNGPMGAPEILDNLKTGAECFKNMAKNK